MQIIIPISLYLQVKADLMCNFFLQLRKMLQLCPNIEELDVSATNITDLGLYG